MQSKPSILVVIANYEFSRNADHLKKCFSKFFPTVLIDSTSSATPRLADRVIPNSYYPGLWNCAVEVALSTESQWMFFLASDVKVRDFKKLSDCISEIATDPTVGIYTPSLRPRSRAAFKSNLVQKTGRLRRVDLIEGFSFLARIDILRELYPIPSSNKYGWAVDLVSCIKARSHGYQIVVDDRISIYHPPSKTQHRVDEQAAGKMGIDYAIAMGIPRAKCMDMVENAQNLSPRYYFRNLSFRKGLDLGCGSRPNNMYQVDELYAIDLVPRDLDSAVNFKIADLSTEPIPWPDQYFDVITAFDFIEHVPRLVFTPERHYPFVELMNQIWRCLKPGGIFHSLTPAYPAASAFQDPTHVNVITEKTFPEYFCGHCWAEMYGFSGRFKLEKQAWSSDSKLESILIKQPGVSLNIRAAMR